MTQREDYLIPSPNSGLIIAIDGVDGCGKGTQIDRLMARLREDYPGREVAYIKNPAMKDGPGILRRVITGEPCMGYSVIDGGTIVSTGVDYNPAFESGTLPDPLSQRLIIYAESVWSYQQAMIPLLERNAIIVCDRSYYLSNYIYGISQGIPVHVMEYILRLHTATLPPPDIAIILDVPAEVAMQRVATRTGQDPNHFDLATKDIFALRRTLFLALSARWEWATVINGNDTPEAVAANVYTSVTDRMQHTDAYAPTPSTISTDGYDPLEYMFIYAVDAMAARMHENSRAKGFYPATKIMQTPNGQDVEVVWQRNAGEALALIAGEYVGEALEAVRHGNPPSDHLPDISLLEEELADGIIRTMEYASGKGHAVGKNIVDKHRFNTGRPHMHGEAF